MNQYGQGTTFLRLQQALQNPGQNPGVALPTYHRPELAQGPTMVSTVTDIKDLMRGVARATVPNHPDRYWNHTAYITARDIWLPAKLDMYGGFGCLIITALLFYAVFK